MCRPTDRLPGACRCSLRTPPTYAFLVACPIAPATHHGVQRRSRNQPSINRYVQHTPVLENESEPSEGWTMPRSGSPSSPGCLARSRCHCRAKWRVLSQCICILQGDRGCRSPTAQRKVLAEKDDLKAQGILQMYPVLYMTRLTLASKRMPSCLYHPMSLSARQGQMQKFHSLCIAVLLE